MKTIKVFFVVLIAFFAATPSCKKFDLNTDDLTLSADLSIFKTTVNFVYVDAATGQAIPITTPSAMKIEVISPTTGLIVNTMGEYQTVFNPNYSFFSFSLNPYSTKPTKDHPLNLLVKTTLDNYLESSAIISLSEERIYNQEFKLINIPLPPVGVLIEEHENIGTTSSTGETQEPISVTTEGNAVGIQIEAGATLRDDTGQPLSGEVSIMVMSVDVSTEEGFKNVPAINQPMITEDGSTSSLFSPIAYTRTAITDESGRKAASITGKNIVVSTALRSSIMNPATKKPIAKGDLVPSYYFDSRVGNWKFFGKDTVSEIDGQLQLVKVIKSKKSTVDEDFSEITYSFDQNEPIDIEMNISLPESKPSLPTTFNIVVEGNNSAGIATEIFNGDVTLFTLNTKFTINNLSADYVSYKATVTGAEMVNANGASQLRTSSELEGNEYEFSFEFTAGNFKDPVNGDGPTRLYLQFSCVPTTGNALFMDTPYLPNSFYLIFSGTGFTGETILQIQGGSFVVPFNPVLQTGGSWQAKVVMGSMEYPTGSGRITVTNNDFRTVDGKVIFTYTPETAEQCDDFKKALGI